MRKWLMASSWLIGVILVPAWAEVEKSAKSEPSQVVEVEKQVVAKMTQEQAKKINLNMATAEELQQVKHFSKRKAKCIVEYRDANGPFKTLEGLLQVKCRGIHAAWLAKVSQYLGL